MLKKHVKQLSFSLILLSHLGFLAAILYEKQQNIYVSIFVVLVIVLLLIRYKKTSLKSKNHDLEHVLTVAFVFFGAIITYVLSVSFKLSSVLAASLVGLVVSFVPSLFKKNNFIKGMPTAVYCGAFVGMTNVNIAPDYIFIALASVITGFLLVGTKDAFHGFGGKLGTLAFGGVTLAFFITFIISRWL
ncbi:MULTISPECIES: hypothetical protein [Polaribacter]|uniref:Uncharacterized protein n=1 Tax=Polaribacter sejongensis TaxID=985043 RepID=A0AAJ1QWU0_9FLAO|nr:MULTISPECIES: hypothetical protein [Polaribacter]MDN3619641.1 hypothetical protein [Polaribacter undariae]UWD33354.1 hypothetical protein NQP51_06645 [Polaribacter undariae]